MVDPAEMLDRFVERALVKGTISRTERTLVGYSGGADSTCLLHLMRRAEFDVMAAHLHHGQRDEADQELERCAEFCRETGVPLVTARADVPAMAEDLRIGLEEAGREARYAFFRESASANACQRIATAHTLSDSAETALFNLIRGSGMSGLAGVPESRENIVRPLLGFDRAETRAYCLHFDLWFHDDPANSDPKFSRARLRGEAIPLLEDIRPGAMRSMARFAEIVGEEDRLLDAMAATALASCERPLNGDLAFLTRGIEIAFDCAALRHLPMPLVRRGFRIAFESLGAALDFAQTTAIGNGILGRQRGSATAKGGSVVAEWDAETATVRRIEPANSFRHPLLVPGQVADDEAGWQLSATTGEAQRAVERRSMTVALPLAAIKPPLYFRSAEAGDRMKPLGFDGTRKVSDLLSEAGLTAAARARLPVVCDVVGPVWIPGVCLSDRAKSATSASAIIVRFGPVPGPNDHN